MKKACIFFLCLTYQIFSVESRNDLIRHDGWVGLCYWSGYKPGGNVVTIEAITSPTAQLQGSALANIAGNLGRASTLGMHAQNAVNAFTDAKGAFKTMFSTFASIAPKLGPCLGMFGAALGFVDALTKPTPGDILDATNRAIGELTREVNDRLDQMKGYIDQKVITLEKELIERDYKTMFNLWASCIKEANKDLANECQRDSYRYISAAQPKFALFSDYMDSWATTPPKKDTVKRIEASLVSFRNYVQLMLMSLKALKDVYDTDESSIGRHYYNLYKTELEEKSQFYVSYAKAAVDEILKMHYGKNGKGGYPATFSCTPKQEIKEGWLIKTRTVDRTECSAILEPSGPTKCTMKQTRRADGNRGERYYSIPSSESSDYGAMKAYARYHINAKAADFASKGKKVIRTFWKNQVLDLVPIWEMFQGSDTRELDEIEAGGLENLDDYSDHFKNRLKKAKKVVGYPQEAEEEPEEEPEEETEKETKKETEE